MDSLSKNKGMLAGLGLLLVLFFLYSFLKPSDIVIDPSLTGTPLGADLLETSQELSQTSLNGALFADRAYLLLTDFSVPIPQQSIGRNNPFQVIGQN